MPFYNFAVSCIKLYFVVFGFDEFKWSGGVYKGILFFIKNKNIIKRKKHCWLVTTIWFVTFKFIVLVKQNCGYEPNLYFSYVDKKLHSCFLGRYII